MSQKVTIDLIDASIPEVNQQYAALPDQMRFPHYGQKMIADPVLWERHRPLDWELQLTWREYRYSSITTAAGIDAQITSDEPGIYVMYARPESMVLDFPRVPLYIGISNEQDTDRPLRTRLKEYLPTRIKTLERRQNVQQALQLYFPVIYVAYALVPRPSKELRALERRLHGFMYPLYPLRDYPPDIKAQNARKSW